MDVSVSAVLLITCLVVAIASALWTFWRLAEQQRKKQRVLHALHAMAAHTLTTPQCTVSPPPRPGGLARPRPDSATTATDDTVLAGRHRVREELLYARTRVLTPDQIIRARLQPHHTTTGQ